MSTEETEDIPEFSLHDRTQLSLNDSARLFNRIEGMIFGGIILLAMAMAVSFLFYTIIDLYGTITPVPDCDTDAYTFSNFLYQPTEGCFVFEADFELITLEKFVGLIFTLHQGVDLFIVIVMMLLGAVGIWWLIKGRKIKQDMKGLKKEYVQQAYYFVLQTSTHGQTDVARDFFDIALDIFPELKERKIGVEKRGREFVIEEKIFEGEGNYKIDIIVDTREGKLFVKNFGNEHVSIDDFANFLKIIKKSYKEEDVFRVVGLAKSFDNRIIEELEVFKIKKKKIPCDLIQVREKGFAIINLGQV